MRAITTLALCLISIMAVAQPKGWHYENGKAGIFSEPEYITGDYDNPTAIMLMVGNNKVVGEMVVCHMMGECTILDFKDAQQYIVVRYGIDTDKWAVEPADIGDGKINGFIIKDAAKFITMLKQGGSFSISLPLFNHGVRQFTIQDYDYPLIWQ